MKALSNFVSLFLVLWTASIALGTELLLVDTWCDDLESPVRIACDPAAGLFYVSSPRSGEIGVYDGTGTLLRRITTVAHPTALATDAAGYLYVADGAAVRKLAADGTLLSSFGENVLRNPHDLAVAPDGRVFVADANDTIRVFDAAGVLLLSFGRPGYPAGCLDTPVSLVLDAQAGELYVADQNNYRVQVFSLAGVFRRSFGAPGNGNYAPGQFLRLWGMDRDAAGNLWVFDSILNAFQVFEPGGAFVALYRVNGLPLRTGLDIALSGNRIYLVAASSRCVLVYEVVAMADVLHLTIMVSPSGERLLLNWHAHPEATAYRIYRAPTPAFAAGEVEDLGSVTDTCYTDSVALAQWERRFYRVIALLPGPLHRAEHDPQGHLAVRHDAFERELQRNHDRPHTVTFGVWCTSCHFSHFAYPDPLPEWWFADHLCKSCHIETGKAQPAQNHFAAADTMFCVACHDPHFHQDQFERYYIRTAIQTPNSGPRVVFFNHATDFIHGAPAYDGICEVCHTRTAYHRNNSSGDHTHHAASSCISCHAHHRGFRP